MYYWLLYRSRDDGNLVGDEIKNVVMTTIFNAIVDLFQSTIISVKLTHKHTSKHLITYFLVSFWNCRQVFIL